jgi:structure-specific recognition protein 1
LRAVLGELFMLEKYIFFVTKQPTLIELADIHGVVFSRVNRLSGVAAARTFDLKIITKTGPEYIFTLISQDEHRPIEDYLKDRKVKVKNDMQSLVELSGGSDSDSDEGFDASTRTTRTLADSEEDSEEDGEDFRLSIFAYVSHLRFPQPTSRTHRQT